MTTKPKTITINKSQVPKSKTTVGTKSGVKNVKVKKHKPGTKSRPQPAPVVEAGYSLYSTDSEEQLTAVQNTPQEVCAKVLSQLTARRTACKNMHKVPYLVPAQMSSTGNRIPFNNRLSSSTPDPEKADEFNNKYFQVIPAEKESALSLYGAHQNQALTGQTCVGYFNLPTKPVHMGAKMIVTSNLSTVPHVTYNAALQENTYSTPNTPFNSTEDGSDRQHESVIEAFQPYIARESTGFTVPTFGNIPKKGIENGTDCESKKPLDRSNRPSGSSKADSRAKDNSVLSSDLPSTAETSGTEYAVLPFAETGTQNQQLMVNLGTTYSLQDGLYQIHPTKDIDKQALETPDILFKVSNVSPVQTVPAFRHTASAKTKKFEIPERDESGKTDKQFAEPNVVTENHPVNLQPQLLVMSEQTSVSEKQEVCKNEHGEMVFQTTAISGTTNQHTSQGPSPNTKESPGFVPSHNYPITVQIPVGLRQQPLSQNVVSLATPPGQYEQLMVIGSNGSQQLVPMATQGMMGNHYCYLGHPDADDEVKRLRYLLKELKECSKISKDVELDRLVKEVDKSVNGIPHLNLNLRTEVDLALQPLRTENCHLRRRLRIVNQQVREREQTEKDTMDGKQVSLEVVQLQAKNSILGTQITEGRDRQTKLANDIKELQRNVNRMKAEKHQMTAELSEKETDHLKLRQECLKETQKSRQELDLMEQQLEGLQLKLEAAERENHILQISLKQRDSEVSRLQDTIGSLKENMSAIMLELDRGKQGERSYIQNSSFSLQRILKLLQEEQKYSFIPTRSVRSDPGKVQTSADGIEETTRVEFNYGHEPHFRLTQEMLEDHDKAWNGDDSQETLRESASDTEIEYALMETKGNQRQRFSKHTLSPSNPHRYYVDERNKPHRRSLSFSPKQIQNYKKSDDDRKWNHNENEGLRNAKKSFASLDLDGDICERAERIYTENHTLGKPVFPYTAEEQNLMDQSRYSITDYFKKYPLPHHAQDTDREAEKHIQKVELPKRQDVYNQIHLFRGTELEASMSAIDDDKFSSVSGRTLSTVSMATTVDDQAFRKGIAMLDANIAKLQSDLQKRRQLLA